MASLKEVLARIELPSADRIPGAKQSSCLHRPGSRSVLRRLFFVKVPDWSTELVERQRVFIEVIRLADSLGVEFAFPTPTLEIETFPGRPDLDSLPAATDQELREISERFASTSAAARPRNLRTAA